MKQGQVRILNEQQVQQLITAPQTLELIETVFRYWAEGKTVNPVKLSLQIAPYHEGHINSMPSYIEPGDLCGVKVVSVFQDNMRDHQLPTTLGTIILHDPQTGLPYSIMGGTHITDLRTGAVSGVMAKYLAKQNSRVLSVVGAGAQGFTSMEMTMLAIGTIEQVRVCDLSEDRVRSFIEKAKGRFPQGNVFAVQEQRRGTAGRRHRALCHLCLRPDSRGKQRGRGRDGHLRIGKADAENHLHVRRLVCRLHRVRHRAL